MKKFQLTMLGTNAAFPAFGRITSCQILDYNSTLVLIDCGEACQIRLNEYRIKRSKIDYICISHLHGDHVYGLPGLLTSFNHKDRKKPLFVIGPKGIQKFLLNTLSNSYAELNYPVDFIELEHTGSIVVIKNPTFSISAFPLKHRIPTYGYRIDEHVGEYNIKKEMISKYSLTVDQIKKVKRGENISTQEGYVLHFEDLVFPKSKPRSYAYCSDTVYDPDIVPYVKNVNVLYHETTYMQDLQVQAEERKHSTVIEAARIAKMANAKTLITGHYSSRYRTVDDLVLEGKQVFSNIVKGYDGVILDIK